VRGQPETIGIETRADLARLKFKREGLAPADLEAQQQRITLNGITAGWEEEVLAYYAQSDANEQPTVVGKLNTVTYEALTRRLTVVKVNGTPLPVDRAVIEQQLNTIYAQAAVKWSVVEDSISVQGIDAKNLDDGASGLLSSYTGQMRKVIDAYFRNSTPAADTYYLFVVEGAKDKNKMGYMPRKKQAGFLFTSAIPNEYFVHTLARELGHGAFRLEHTFSEYASLSKGATDNLMDYGTGTRLNKYQWDYIHDPVAVLGLFEEDEESALTAWSGTLVDDQHTELFDHVYNNNHIGELKYLTEIERLITSDPSKQTLDLNYDDDDDHKEWVNSWKIRVVNSETVLNNTIKVIQDAKKGEKLGKIYLRPNHIYIAKYKYNDRDYPIAIYNAGTSEVMDKVFTKVEITDIDDLDEEENKKRVYIEETFFSYFIVAFYEDGKSTPTLMIQVEKFPFSDLLHNSMEEWLKFLKILVEGPEEKPDQVATEEPKETEADNEEEVSLGTDATTGKRAIPQGTVMERYQQSSTQAVQDAVNAVGNEDNAACNVCARAAFYYMTGDAVLFPKIGSCLDDFNGCQTTGENYFKGEVGGNGSASSIVSDFNNLSTSGLKDYFDQETKRDDESYEQFWARLQGIADTGSIIVGTYSSNHVFMLVGGGSIQVVNNKDHTVNKEGRYLADAYKTNPTIDEGDKIWFLFCLKEYLFCSKNHRMWCEYKIRQCAPLWEYGL
jgi:uncharacterized protein Veg